MFAADRNARRVDLREARVGEERSALVRAPRGRHVGIHRVGREIIRRAVSAGREDDGVRDVALEGSRREVARDDAARLAVNDDEIEHFPAGEQLHRLLVDLPHQRLVGADEKLLAGLAARVEGARHLRAAKRTIVQQAAVLARERDALRHALVDDVHAQLREPVDVGFTRAVIAAFDRVVEEPIHAVAVVLIVLGRVDAALRRDAVRAPGAVLNAEVEDVVAELPERGRRRGAREARADDEDRVLALVGRVDQLHLELVPVPLFRNRAGRNVCVQLDVGAAHSWPPAKCAHRAMTMKAPAISTATTLPVGRMNRVQPGLFAPSD